MRLFGYLIIFRLILFTFAMSYEILFLFDVENPELNLFVFSYIRVKNIGTFTVNSEMIS